MEAEGWVSLEFDFFDDQLDPVTAYVKNSQTEDASSSNRFGSFTMRYELKTDANVIDPSNDTIFIPQDTTIERGYLDVNDTSIQYRSAGYELPPRALDVDFTSLNNVQGVIQHNVRIDTKDAQNNVTSNQYSVRHQIYVNEGNNRYCQKFLDAHLYTQTQQGWQEGADVGEAVLQAEAEGNNVIEFEVTEHLQTLLLELIVGI